MLEPKNNDQLPPIPGKRYFTIGEVSDLCGVKPHVLRYWEQEFPQLKPVKRRGNRRYHRRSAQPPYRRRRAGGPQPEPAADTSDAAGIGRADQDSAPLGISGTQVLEALLGYHSFLGRGVAQPGSALAWGAR